MRVEIKFTFDPTEAVEEAVNGCSLSGLGPDGTSEYEISETEVEWENGEGIIILQVEHAEGKFVSKDGIAQEVISELEYISGLEVTE